MPSDVLAPPRPKLPLTEKQDLRTRRDSVIWSWVVEDSIVSEVDRQPDQLQLALVAAIAQAALIQMDAEFRGMATLGHNPIVWTIFEDERQFIE